MRIVMFCHSLVSDWNHGNAHFLRGLVTALQEEGHRVDVHEPSNAWSVRNLVEEYGTDPIARFHEAYPHLQSTRYDEEGPDLERALDGADLVLVHEWNSHSLVARIGEHRATHRGYRLLFHDTHHRSVTAPGDMAAYQLENYDGVLAFGESIAERYRYNGWGRRVWTFHEAADVRHFYPHAQTKLQGHLVWIGNWGDEERAAELREFLIEPVQELGLKARIHGVRYPAHALERLREAGIEFSGWIPNYEVPKEFAHFRFTVHVPRRPYAEALRGIPTIRVFEALACGIPLISAPWEDSETLFTPGEDFLFARDGKEMKTLMQDVLSDPALASSLAQRGLETIRQRHTCQHRARQLMEICEQLELNTGVLSTH
jgi:spore maturation protein CgeB